MAENKEVTRYDLMLEKYLIEGISYDANTICKADKADLEQLAADSYWQGWQDSNSKPVNCAIFDVNDRTSSNNRLKIEPVFDGISTAVSQYKVTDDLGSIWMVGTREECDAYLYRW